MAHAVEGESSSSDPFNSTPNWKYDVFLSFAGEDTRLNFVDHLNDAFNRSGIETFRDDKSLKRGGVIKQDLCQAIQDSLSAIVVISENYAKSIWCLEELKTILKSQKELDRWVVPIFYNVDPADVRKQRNCFQEAMDKHEDQTEVLNWKKLLCEIGNLSGWDTRGKHEADLIKEIVADVWTYLSAKLPSYREDLVGIESKVGDMMPLLEIGLEDRLFVGIWGMGGVGKTTLARAVFEKLSDRFEVHCFLDKVRETFEKEGRVVSLQEKLLSDLKIQGMKIFDDYEGMKMIRKLLHNKKVLLVIDDVDHKNQLNNLAERPDWFGKGSRIIFTARDKHLLTSHKVDEQRIYEMKTMKRDESLQLFSNKAFDKGHPPDEDYLKLSESVVEYAGCLPLALEVLGSFLHRRHKAEWIDNLDKVKKINPDKRIFQVLKISYDGLDEQQRAIFLDIACFFKGWQKKEVTHILESCGLNPTIEINVLIERTLLVETKECTLEMHDLLQELGRNIVHQESLNNIGKRSRLWKFEEIKEALEYNKGSEEIQAIVMEYYHEDQGKIKVHPEAFSKMSNIRLLLLDPEDDEPFILPWGLEFFPSALKVVRWPSFPLEALPLEPLSNKLVDIQMHYSKIKQLWNDIQFMKELKFIDLRYSLDFTETPDFSRVPNLKHLRLSGCKYLVKIHPSLGQLKELVEVYLNGCENLEILPEKLETNSLMKLDLNGCKKVAVLPEFGVGVEKLSYINVSDTAITRLPESLGFLTGLEYLYLRGCKIFNLDKFLKIHITRQISGLNITSLTELYLNRCGLNDGSIPDNFGGLSSLIVLDLSYNHFVNLPSGCFSGLSRLVFLLLDCCKRLKSLPRLPPRLIRLNATGCDSMESLSSDRSRLWNLVASLDHECRGRTKYVIYNDEEKEEDYDYSSLLFKHAKPAECPPLRDFFAIIPGFDMPSWFPNKEYEKRREYEIKVDIPPDYPNSKWCGIVVCFLVSGIGRFMIDWSSKAAEDDHYRWQEWGHGFAQYDNQIRHQCIMVLELNEETCWKHLRPHNNSLHIQISTCSSSGTIQIMGCGWRLICKEDIKEWCNHSHFNQLASPHDDIKLHLRIPRYFLEKVYLDEDFMIEE